MGKSKQLSLTDKERRELEHGIQHGEKYCFRARCRAVLLKADVQTEMAGISVCSWVHRFEPKGIKGLEARSDRGRKAIMDCSDKEIVSRVIEQDRQSVSKANATWEAAMGKEVSEMTFKRFLSALAQDISV